MHSQKMDMLKKHAQRNYYKEGEKYCSESGEGMIEGEIRLERNKDR